MTFTFVLAAMARFDETENQVNEFWYVAQELPSHLH
jgi:hypothetical protein